jgi:hypothetical protein
MDKYTFKWNLIPPPPTEHAITVPPFDLIVVGSKLELRATADAADEQRLHEQSGQVAHSLAGSLSYELAERFEVEYQGRHVLRSTGQQAVSFSVTLTVNPAPVSTAQSADLEAERSERERQRAQQRIWDRTKRAAMDVNLRDMLEHWSRYVADSEGRLHPLYDVLQVVERLHGGRRRAASALNMSCADLGDLGRISNDPKVFNGRHPGRSPGPHRVATRPEVEACERAAKAIIEKYESQIVL